MKKLIILIALAFTTLGYSQAEFEKIAITENTATAETSRIVSQQPVGGELNYIDALNLPISNKVQDSLAIKENTSNKATDFTTINNTLYPSVQAVKTELDLKADDSDVIHKTGNETKTGSLSVMGTTSPISLIGNSINNTGVSASSDNGLPLSVSTTTSAKLVSFIYNASEKSSINSSGGYVINGVTSTNALLAGGGNLANPISGTGTTNRIGVWTSASTQGNSSISQDGSGNITISGGSGADVLNLVKSTGASLSLSGSTGTTNPAKIAADNTTNPDLYFFVGGLERGRFSSSGGFNVSGGITATTYTGGATLTDIPTAPTAAVGTNTTQIATMAALQTAITNNGIITTATNITNATLTDTSLPQNGKTLYISNGATNINYTVNGNITASFVKGGTGSITFVQGSGRTMVAANGALVFNGAQYSTASIVSFGTTDIVYINNF